MLESINRAAQRISFSHCEDAVDRLVNATLARSSAVAATSAMASGAQCSERVADLVHLVEPRSTPGWRARRPSSIAEGSLPAPPPFRGG